MRPHTSEIRLLEELLDAQPAAEPAAAVNIGQHDFQADKVDGDPPTDADQENGRHALAHLYVPGQDDDLFGIYSTVSAASSGDMDDGALVNVFRLAHDHFGALRGLRGHRRLGAGVLVFGFLFEQGAVDEAAGLRFCNFHDYF